MAHNERLALEPPPCYAATMTSPYDPPNAPIDSQPPAVSPPQMRTSGLAIASLVFSAIPCCVGPGSLVGIGLGIAALVGYDVQYTKGTSTLQLVFTKEGGEWKIVSFHISPLEPSAGAP